MNRNSFKNRKSLGRGQKENAPGILNNGQRENSSSNLPTIHLPCKTLNLRHDPLKKTKKLPLLDLQKNRISKSTQHFSSVGRLYTNSTTVTKVCPVKQYQINELQNIKLTQQHAVDQLQYLLKDDKPREFLQKHIIKAPMRAKMVDWMIEVLNSYKCCDKTFFQSVTLMDQYYTNTPVIEQGKDLHLLGVCCMFMIIKLQQVVPIRLKTIYQKIGHRKIPMDKIKNKQQNILNVMNFNILVPTLYDIITITLSIWKNQIKSQTKIFEKIVQFSLYMSKMVITDYTLLSIFSKAQLTSSIIYLSFKLFKQINQQFQIQTNSNKIRQILKISLTELNECSNKVLHLIKNFEEQYPNLVNLKKFHKLNLGQKS